MATVIEIYDFLAKFAPVGLKMEFDNVGFLVGRSGSEISKIMVSLDITNDVISEAICEGAGLIVSHHPLFFLLKNVTDSDMTGTRIIRLLENGVAAVCMHTNLDAARGGVNDALAKAAGIADQAELFPAEALPAYGRSGYLKNPCGLAEYLGRLKESLNTNGLRYHDAGRDVCKVAVVGGSGGSELVNAHAAECDTFVTADIKYDVFLEAKELGINLIDADHFCTENVVTGVLAEKLRAAFPEIGVIVSKKHGQTARFFS